MIWLALTVMVLFGLGGIGAFVYGTVLT
ncbi:MAG: hypothetical protein JWO15_3748, partial [Sphingomonadales bacterium]|nr:hypothetical protein [Sphingomonadales bacterium]